ncbi:protein involved in gliding motility SprA [Balneicella halophila]|uniref:Protein involved in gliding motility SprA n=1 Tax=Balneicella halophila TaxID=1537566 RepID=A0A7L4UPU7_BALHA|nr:cell surface protein SprA [Balneicella halophila]PVX51064.1 protein involved in gliding motility SprA [Balneicella halophila]
MPRHFTILILCLLCFPIVAISQQEEELPINKKSPFYIKENEEATNEQLPYVFEDDNDNTVAEEKDQSPLFLSTPENVATKVVYDPETKSYYIMQKVGDQWYRRPRALSFEEYLKFDMEKSKEDFWFRRARDERQQYQYRLLPGKKYEKEDFIQKIFGDGTIALSAKGAADIKMGLRFRKVDNPAIPERYRKHTSFFMDPKFQASISGSIGDVLNLDINYDTEATFDFNNKTKLAYDGNEDDIIQKVEAGNVSLDLQNSLIRGGKDLFGVKTDLQFGKLYMTTVFSQQKGEMKTINLDNGAQTREFEVDAVNYDENRHFFLSKYFRDNYNKTNATLPVFRTDINVVRVEVWITNVTVNYEREELRNLMAFVDLGENQSNISNPYFSQTGSFTAPSNETNSLYPLLNSTYSGARDINTANSTLSAIPNFSEGVDFVKLETARKLDDSEFTFHPKLGYISLRMPLRNNEIVAVAYEYIKGGESYRVGEFTNSGPATPQNLYVKLLKGTSTSPNLPTWDLMMKNIYSIGASNISPSDFMLDVAYKNDKAGSLPLNYIEEGDIAGKPLLEVLNLDRLNSQLDRHPDGMFDYIAGTTFIPERGLVIFPVLEPFGEDLRKAIGDENIADKYVFEEIYTQTQSQLMQRPSKDKFQLLGTFTGGEGGDINLGSFNIPQGSVRVYAGSRLLREGYDYIVDYMTGKVKIINPALLESSIPIRIDTQNNSLFDLATKTLVGTDMTYRFNDNFYLGATAMYYKEQALYSKVNIGDEPVANFMWGLHGGYSTESNFLTRMLNKLPFYKTKEKVLFDVKGEFAQLMPGHNKLIGDEGNAYIDDFEGSKQIIDLRASRLWFLASTPGKQPAVFPEAEKYDNLEYGYNRALLSWFIIDPLFHNSNSPVAAQERSNSYVRKVRESELFPNQQMQAGTSNLSQVLTLHFDPSKRGQYNFDASGVTGISAGIDAEGNLKKPETRWGGIMREMPVTDFEASNVEYIEFWLLDPFIDEPTSNGGDLYFNFGDISEDILKDSRKAFENGLPTSENDYKVDTTVWGRISKIQSVVNAYDTNSIDEQDLGLDGLNNEDELAHFKAYLDEIANLPGLGVGSQAYQNAMADPANDDYIHFRSEDYDAQNANIIERYYRFNNLEGNARSDNTASKFSTAYTTLPDVEDINKDNTLNEAENYFQYHIPLAPKELSVGRGFITDMMTINAPLANGTISQENWYQFKVPLKEFEAIYGNVSDFRSIRFMRMYMRGFAHPVTLRFARLNLVRDDWRRYEYSLEEGKEGNPQTNTGTAFDVSAVSLIENSRREPINYVMPPNIKRVIDPSRRQARELNEQALQLRVENLKDGDARAVLKRLRIDVRRYKRLIMDVHAEQVRNIPLSDNATTVFLRMGSDFTDNYYEYEIPLKLTAPGRYSDSNMDRKAVWPDANRIDFEMELLKQVKLMRNQEQSSSGSIDYATKYTRTLPELKNNYDAGHAGDKISVKGNPNLMNLRSVLIGIRNPKDNGGDESVEVWVNELRVADFENDGGWAANLNMTTQLSDLGALSFSGQMMTAGFGSIEEKLNQRLQEDVMHYDIAATLDLGKLLPEKARLQVPMYYNFSEHKEKPRYNELDPDIELDRAIDNAVSQEQKDNIENASETYIKTKSFSLTDVKVLPKEDQKIKPWSLTNFSATYAHNEISQRDPIRSHDFEENYRGVLRYDYSPTPKPVEPFKNSRFLSTRYYKLIKDFNFYYLPSRISIRSDLNRHYRSIMRRNVISSNFISTPTFDSDFIWNRYYDIDYPLTKSLKMSISAINMSRIEEDYVRDQNDLYDVWKGIIWDSFRDGGRTVNYNHRVNFDYQLPINKIPFMDWIKANAGYGAEYRWNAGPDLGDEELNIGNQISNQQMLRLDGNIDLVQLYNKSDYLRALNQELSGRKVLRGKTERKTYEQRVDVFKPNKGKLITHNFGTKAVSLKVTDENGKVVRASKKIVNNNRIRVTVYDTIVNAKIELKGTVVAKRPVMNRVGEGFLKVLMGIRNIKLEYDRTKGTMLSGFTPEPSYFGLNDFSFNGAPGIGFVLGKQDEGFLEEAVNKDYILRDNIVNEPYLMTKQERFTIRSTIEPIRSLRITLNATREYFDNNSQYYSFDDKGNFSMGQLFRTGNLSMSYLSLKSSFFSISDRSTYNSTSFQDFLDARKGVSERLAKKYYGNTYKSKLNTETGFYDGFGGTAQDVLVESFHEAYGGKRKGLLPSISQIMPNWKVSYSGLNNVPIIQRLFKRVNIDHSYQSRYSVGGYTTNLDYDGTEVFNNRGDLVPEIEVNSITIDERFAPLVGIKMEWQNNLTTNVSINRGHLMQLNVGSGMLNESANNEWVFDFGYRFEDVNLFIGRSAKSRKFKNDLRILAGFTLRKDYTILRQLFDGESQLTSGQESFLYKLAADYALSDRLNLRLFYDRTVRNPYVSRSFPTIVSNVGFSVRFNFTDFEKEYRPFVSQRKRRVAKVQD